MSGAIRKEDIEDDVEVTEGNEDNLDVEIVDDTPEPDRGRFVAPESTDNDDDIEVREEEIKDYKEAIQKRIKNLGAQTHAERRAKEQAIRERDEAIAFAKRMQDEYGKLRDYSNTNEAALVENAKKRTEVQIQSLQRQAKEAYELGDSEKFIELQTELQRAILEHDRYAQYRPQPQPQDRQQRPQQQPQQTVQNQRPPSVPPPDPTALAWHDKNKWFMGSGEMEAEMTAYAFAVSDNLVQKKGVDPKSQEYYDEISKSVRKRFPDYAAFKSSASSSEPGKRTQTVVAPASRSAGGNRKTVQLTPTQVRLASRLGLTVEQYAKQLLAEQNSQ